MPYPTFTAGSPLTAADLTAMQWQQVSQGSDQTINNSTTLTATSLILPAVANATYKYELYVGYTNTSDTADIKFDWTVPTSGSVTRFVAGPGTSATGGSTNYTTTLWRRTVAGSAIAIGGSSTSTSYFEFGEIDGGDGGDVTFRFAQNTATVANTVLSSTSTLWYVRVG